jgi:hypothetical protein
MVFSHTKKKHRVWLFDETSKLARAMHVSIYEFSHTQIRNGKFLTANHRSFLVPKKNIIVTNYISLINSKV